MHDLIVSGVITPDATGYYDEDGFYNGKQVYTHVGGTWHIWYSGAHGLSVTWLTTVVGSFPGDYWSAGNYSLIYPMSPLTPHGTATGSAIVTLPP